MQVFEDYMLGAGAFIDGEELVFNLPVDSEVPVMLLLFEKETGKLKRKVPMARHEDGGNMFSARVAGEDPEKLLYQYEVDDKIVCDPAARLISGWENYGDRQIDAPMAAIMTEKYNWKDDTAPRIPWEDVISYVVHPRGYTMAGGSKAGTFEALIDRIPYWKDLGINQIILMPSYEFDELGKRKPNYWGYGEAYYYAPKAAYRAGDHADLSFKNLVQALHKKNMELIMEFSFAGWSLEETARCLRYWVKEYHVDGFVLVGENDICASELARFAGLGTVKLIAGAFDQGRIYPKGRNSARRLAVMNGDFASVMRRAVKSDEGMIQSFLDRFAENPRDLAALHYITSHDGFTLSDLVSYNQKHNEENGEGGLDGAVTEYSWNCGVEGATRKRSILQLRKRQMKNLMTMLLLAQGTPMIRGGDEFGNSQQGNNNPYCLDNEVSWVDARKSRSVYNISEYVKKLIAFRKKHPILHQGGELGAGNTGCNGYPVFSTHSRQAWYASRDAESRHVGIMECGIENGEETYLYLAFNFHWEEQEFALPYLPEGWQWKAVLTTADQIEEMNPIRLFTLQGRSIMILEGERVYENTENGSDRSGAGTSEDDHRS